MKRPAAFAIKAEIADLHAPAYSFAAQKTMYGGKSIAAGDRVFLFASETQGGSGLFACGIVTESENLPLRADLGRQTPRVSVAVKREASVAQRLGRPELRRFMDGADDAPQTELHFKLYRQATNKIVGLTDGAAKFLDGRF